jgi:hypothetical protein
MKTTRDPRPDSVPDEPSPAKDASSRDLLPFGHVDLDLDLDVDLDLDRELDLDEA